MSLTYQTVIEKDFSSGINKLAAEDAVPASFVENLENMQPNAQGYVEKRKGYQAYAGSLPLRVVKAERTAGGLLCLYFDELEGTTAAIDFSTLKPSPVIIYGKSSLDGWSTLQSKYYSTFSVDPRVKLGTAVTLSSADVGAKSKDIFIGLGYNAPDKEGTKANEVVYADSLTVNPTTFDITVGAIPNIPASPGVNCFVYIKNHATVSGESWAATLSGTLVGSTRTYTITQINHQLNTQNYITRFYTLTGLEIFPDSLTVAGSTITAVFTDNDGAQWDGQLRVVIASIPEIDIESRTVVSGLSTTITFPIAADFAFFEVYQVSGATLQRVFPDSIKVENQVATVAVTNNSPNEVVFRILWDRASVRTNKLCVTEAGIAGIDTTPQLCLYGLDHEELYPEKTNKAGWVTHIDSYKSEGEKYLIAGLGWNLFKAVTDSSLPLRQPLLRVSGGEAVRAGPLFASASTPTNFSRDRISYSFTGGNEGWGDIQSIQYQQSTGWIKVVVSTPNRVKHNNKGTPAVDFGHDKLTLQNTSQKVHRGEWPIMNFEETSAHSLTFWVYNPIVDSADYDEDLVGEAGVFTDKVEFVAPSNKTYALLVGDIIESASFQQGISGSLSCVSTILSGGKAYSYFTGVGETIEFPGGQVYTVRRTGRMIRVRDVNNPSTNPYERFVAGDVIAFSDRERRYRILHVVAADVTGIAVSFDGETQTATVTSVNSTPFKVGQWLTLSAAGRFSGEYQIKEIPDTTSIVLDSSNVKDSTTSVPTGAYIQGNIFELSYEDEFYDDPNSLVSVSVPLRWFPLENPTGSARRVKHFESSPYTNQPFVRSVMAQDNMYFANYNDHLLKYDGVSLYRSGLIRWQPGLFASIDTTNAAKIIVPAQKSITMDVTGVKPIYLKAAAQTYNAFAVGTKIEIPGSTINPFIVESIDASNYHVFLNKQIDIAAVSNIQIKEYQPNIYRYYFRFTAYDANDNVIISATTGSNEFYVSLTESGAIRIRLLSLPKFEQLNYSRIFLEVYRTRRNSVAPFYNVFKKAVEFNVEKPYIDIVDTLSDEALPTQADDAVLTFLSGERLGNGLSQPPQAKYCTVADNRLVLSNIQDDPKIQIDIFNNPAITDITNKVFHLRKDSSKEVNDLTFEVKTDSTAWPLQKLETKATGEIYIYVQQVVLGLAVNHWVYLYDSTAGTTGSGRLGGWYQVTEISGDIDPGAGTQYMIKLIAKEQTTDFTLTTPANSGYVDHMLACTDGIGSATSFPVYTATDYNYSWQNAGNDVIYSVASRFLLRLSNAINFSQTVSSEPWVYANAGLDLGGQTMVLTFPENKITTTPEFVLPPRLTNVEYYGNKVKVVDTTVSFTSNTVFAIDQHVKLENNVWVVDTSPYTAPYYVILEKTGAAAPYSYKAAYAQQIGAVTAKFPSRVVFSYQNYAEVFHRPFDENNYLSESIVDVNPADGQEITGVFPFFSESTFTASLKAASVIVFKTNSIYIIDPVTRKSQQIETNGLGCTAPYSIAATREGLMFANEAGLYRLTRSLTVEPIGAYIDRLWREDINHAALDLMQGHAYGIGRKYKVSIPKTNETTPSNVLVYDYTRENSQNTFGSWSQYTNHAATGWCNLLEDAYFGSTRGRVYKVSNANSKYDYQDDGTAISGFTVFRALDFGDSAIRKRVLHLLVHYRIPNLTEGQVDTNTATVSMGINLVDNFMPLDTFKLDVPNSPDGLSTLTPNKQVTLRYAVRNPKSLYFQVKIEDNGLHTPLQVTGLSFRVSGLSTEGVKEAAQTMKE